MKAMDECEGRMWNVGLNNRWIMQVLGASTTEERGGCGRMNSAKRREKNDRTERRRCQQNTWKERKNR
jgi:hypothetical protein